MPLSNTTTYRTKLIQIACGLALFFFGLYFVRNMMGAGHRGISLLKTIIGATVLIVFLIALDKRYWLFSPLFISFGFRLPALPFSAAELGTLVVIVAFFARIVLKRDAPQFRAGDILPAVPVFVWIAMVFCLNPTGIHAFGSSSIGGRFYFQVVLGFLSMLVFSSLRFDEKDAKVWFFCVATGLVFTFGNGLFVASGQIGRASHYELIVASDLLMLLLSRFTLSEVVFSLSRLVAALVLAILSVYSGKRKLLGTLALLPVMRTFLTGREKTITAFVIVASAVLLAFGVAGDRSLYQLPVSAKRALSVVVPAYRNSSAEGWMKDLFRERVRQEAREKIAESPWFGRKGFAMDLEETAWMMFGGGGTDQFEGSVSSGNLHNTWYAYASDFGIPCMLLWAFFTIWVLRFSFRACRFVVAGRWLPACCLYLSLGFWIGVCFSYTSGHAAYTTFGTCVNYGYLLAVVRGYERSVLHGVRHV